MRLIFLGLIALASGPAAAADQFDLICTGHHGGLAKEPFNVEMRVDLRSKKYCDDDCKEVRAIAKIEPGRITFSDVDDNDLTAQSWVDRNTGHYNSIAQGQVVNDTVDATCEKAPFKSIPVHIVKNKF